MRPRSQRRGAPLRLLDLDPEDHHQLPRFGGSGQDAGPTRPHPADRGGVG